MKKILIIQARMGSERFPGKVLELLGGRPVLEWVVNAAKKVETSDSVVVATSTHRIDNAIEDWCRENQVNCFRGSEQDVLARYFDAATFYSADVIVRLTADCPLLQPEIISQVLYCVSSGLSDYASNVSPPTWPDGLDCEAFTFRALKKAYLMAVLPSEREHVTPFIRNNPSLFRIKNIALGLKNLGQHRWTIDTPEDLEFIEKLIQKSKGSNSLFKLLEILENTEDLQQPPYKRNAGFEKSLEQENMVITNFSASQSLLERAKKVIPLGAQTFSKSYIQYPENTSPFFVTQGRGGHVWDVDGNQYVDLINALLPNVLGYGDETVNDAIVEQLGKGISFSLSTEVEVCLAEKLCQIIPCAEKVRFAKNGTDVTSAAVRLARAYTGRDQVLVCGYHGWQDWSIGTTSRNKGVPKVVSELSQAIPYNDLTKLAEELKNNKVACLIMEPCNVQIPHTGYLENVLQLCEQYGALLVFDEIITGFRFSLGGAQEYFGVTPHLSCFGKAMGNGMPISAIVGRADIMQEMENIFFSGTFGGETLSIVAALATIQKIEQYKVIEYLWDFGGELATSVSQLIMNNDLEQVIKLQGYQPWKVLSFSDDKQTTSFEIKTYFMQEMIKRGILINGSHNVCFAHTRLDQQKILTAYSETLPLIRDRLAKGTLQQSLLSPVIKPLFRIR